MRSLRIRWEAWRLRSTSGPDRPGPFRTWVRCQVLCVVEAGERHVDGAGRGNVVGRDMGCTWVEFDPEPVAHHLELNRLHARPLHLHRFGPPLHLDPSKVLDDLLRRRRRELDTFRRRRPGDGLHRRVRPQQVDAVSRLEMVGDQCQIRIELRDEVLTHREQRPPATVGEHPAQLDEELLFRVPVGGIEGEDFFELIEDQTWILVGRLRVEPADVVVEVHPGQVGGIHLLLGRPGLLQRGHHAEDVAVGFGLVAGARRFVANANRREHLELSLLQLWAEPGLDERGLAGAGHRVEQNDPMGHEARSKLPDLSGPAVDPVVRTQRPRPHVRVVPVCPGGLRWRRSVGRHAYSSQARARPAENSSTVAHSISIEGSLSLK